MDIHKSLEKILESKKPFGDLFYDVFFDRYPDAADYFDGVDMQRQALVLTMALTLVAQYHSQGYPAIKQYLRKMGTKHSDRGIPREFYPKWRDAMLIALEQFHGDDWNDTVASQWRESIDSATQTMFRGYDRHVEI